MNPYEMLSPSEWASEHDIRILDRDQWPDGLISLDDFFWLAQENRVEVGPRCELFR